MSFFESGSANDQRVIRHSRSTDQRSGLKPKDNVPAVAQSSVLPSPTSGTPAQRSVSKRVTGPRSPLSSGPPVSQTKHRPTASLPPEMAMRKMRSTPELLSATRAQRSGSRNLALPAPTLTISPSFDRPLRRLPELPSPLATPVAISPAGTELSFARRSPAKPFFDHGHIPGSSHAHYMLSGPSGADDKATLSPMAYAHGKSARNRASKSPSTGYGSDSSGSRLSIAPVDIKRLMSNPAQTSPMPSPRRQSTWTEKRSSVEAESAGSDDASNGASASRAHERRFRVKANSPLAADPIRPTSQITRFHSLGPIAPRKVNSGSRTDDITSSYMTPDNVADVPASTRNAAIGRSQSARPLHEKDKAPVLLTPAASVAMAYKQQEQRREEIERSYLPPTNIPDAQLTAKMHPAPSSATSTDDRSPYDADEKEEDRNAVPYYTVAGSDRVVRAGSRLDKSLDVMYYSEPDRKNRVSKAAEPPSKGLGRKLSRKKSNRSRKSHDIGQSSGSKSVTGSNASGSDAFDGTTTQASRLGYASNTSGDRKKSFSRPSMESYVHVKAFTGRQEYDDPRDNAKGGRRDKERQASKDADNGTPKNVIWKLVKRFSSGALRDTRQRHMAEAPPPVPTIPKDFLPPTLPPIQTVSIPDGTKFLDSRPTTTPMEAPPHLRPSLSRSRPSTSPSSPRHRPSTSPSHLTVDSKPHRQHRTASANSTGARRPSDTTRSSFHSDFASTPFDRSRSTRSSMSSLGEVLPPTSSITKPRSASQHDSPKSRRDENQNHSSPPILDVSKEHSDSKDFVSSSLPHVLPTLSFQNGSLGYTANSSTDEALVDDGDYMAAFSSNVTTSDHSPVIPVFQIDNSVNHFSPRRRPESPIEISPPAPSLMSPFPNALGTPPPRPRRSPHRGLSQLKTSPAAAASQSPVTPLSSKSAPERHRDANTIVGNDDVPGLPSSRTPRRAATISSKTRTHRMSASVTFRDMKESWKHTWSDKEKSEKWDDLLQRSEKAGGTLHVGIGGLLSDASTIISDSISIADIGQ